MGQASGFLGGSAFGCNCNETGAVGDKLDCGDTGVIAHKYDYASWGACGCLDEQAPPEVLIFEVYLNKSPGTSLGVNVDRRDGLHLVVDAIGFGLVRDWNLLHPNFAVQRDDLIIEVNGVRGDAERIIQECKKCEMLAMKVARPPKRVDSLVAYSVCGIPPHEFDIIVDKGTGLGLGVGVDHQDDVSLKIINVDRGLIHDWNREHPHMRVKPGDRIVSVNGVSGSAKEIVEECKKPTLLEMKICRSATARFDCMQEELV